MRPRGTVSGPLILIAIGVIFLLHAVSPTFDIGYVLSRYWPFFLIFWGAVQLIELCGRFAFNRALPLNGVSASGWFLVVLICIFGLIAFEVQRPDNWWRRAGLERGVEAFGQEREFSIDPIQQTAGRAPRIIIESFRGDAKITGTDGPNVTVGGHKVIRAFESSEADRANSQTPVEAVVAGNTVRIRCNQERAGGRFAVTDQLEIAVPKGASIEASGSLGDFDISSLAGDVSINSENAGVRLQDIQGSVKVETRRSDIVRCANVKGPVELRGHGDDVELSSVTGQVTISGDYTGTISLHDLAKPVRIENLGGRTQLDVQQVPGEIRLDRGSLNLQNVVGPLRLSTKSTDVTLDGFTNGVELSVDRGDIDLRPGRIPLGKMTVHTRSGNIELALPQSSSFALSASTDHGDIDNQFGEALKERSEGQGARLEGTVGSGPDVNLTTDRGSITVRKSSKNESEPAASPVPTSGDKPGQVALLQFHTP